MEEFGDFTDTRVMERLGNVVLVEQAINSSLGNKPYSKKRPVYLQSKLLLTRALAERPSVGVSTRIDVAVAPLEAFPTWNEAAVGRRQSGLAALARQTWHVPVAGGAAQ